MAPGRADDEAAVRAAVELANSPAVWGEALRRGDPAPLASAWTGDSLGYFSAEVEAYRARGLRLVSRLQALEWVAVTRLDADHAEALTRERWQDWICTADGEPRGWRAAYAADRYALTRQPAGWRVEHVEIALLDGSFDWTDAEPDADSPCATVVAPA